MSINKVFISGNLTRDCEIRSTAAGTQILSFGMAVNDRRRNPKTNEWEDYPNFLDCVLFGNRAEWLSKELHKGKKVYIEGKLRYSTWERDGQKRSKVEIVVDDIDFERQQRQQDGPYGQNASQQGNYGGQQQYGARNQPQGFSGGYQQQAMYDEDIPWS